MSKLQFYGTKKLRFLFCVILGALFPLAALAQPPASILAEETARQFSQHAEQSAYQINHNPWDQFLAATVFDTGPSSRRPAPRRRGGVHTGTRVSTGSRSKYRYEGNRIFFHLFNDDTLEFIVAYRSALVDLMGKYDYTLFGKDEQLAFWLNLHNAVVANEIAKRHPISRPSTIRIREQGNANLFEAKLVAVNGVQLSLNDIRYGIVYRYWDNPDVIYGFWDGTIGGPDISPIAYNGANVWETLKLGGRRYVNSLRGVESRSGSFRVSESYQNARQLFSNWPNDLYAHLQTHAGPEVSEILLSTPSKLSFVPYDSATADLSSGETARFGGSDNVAAVLSLKPEDGSDIPVDILQNFGAPVSSDTMRGGVTSDTQGFTRRNEVGLPERREGTTEITDVETDDPDLEQEEDENEETPEE